MPLIANFTASQLEIDLRFIQLVDTSIGTDSNIIERRVFIKNYADEYVVPTDNPNTQYITWGIGFQTINLNVLPISYSFTITVDWIDNTGTPLYEVTKVYCFDAKLKRFFYYLSQQIMGNPPIVQNTNYFINAANFWTATKAGEYAIEIGQNTIASQNQLNIATNLSQQQNKYF